MGLKKPSGLGVSKKRRSNNEEIQSNKRTRHDAAQQEANEGEEEVVMPSTGEGPVSDLSSLYDKFQNASDQAEASGWLRGVMHESDRLLRNSESPSADEEPLSASDISRIKGFYGAALLRLGLLGPEMRTEGEPVEVRKWLEVALPQLESAPSEFKWDLVSALWSLCAFHDGEEEEEEKWLERARKESEGLTLEGSEGLLGLAGLVLPAASEFMSFQVTERLVEFLANKAEGLEEEKEEEDVQAMLGEAQLVLGSKGADLLAEDHEEVKEATQKALRRGTSHYETRVKRWCAHGCIYLQLWTSILPRPRTLKRTQTNTSPRCARPLPLTV